MLYDLYGNFVFLSHIMMVILIPVLMSIQERVTSPLLPGMNLPVAHWRYTCGLLSVPPNEYTGYDHIKLLEMMEGGLLSLTGSK